MNCAAFSDDLIESELFGIERRVASNVDARAGIFERAHGGTLFLDEIGDMPLGLQAKLLRVLQEHEFIRVGGTKAISADFRLITATNQDLRKMIREQRFREDLYFRIHQLPIELPPLHERRIDIPLLAEHFIRKYCEENGRPVPRMSKAFVTTLLRSKWPGNVRELQYYVERVVVMSTGPVIEPIFLPSDLAEEAKRSRSAQIPEFNPELSSDLKSALVDFESAWITRALETSNWNQREAARKLGLVEATLRYRMRGLGISTPGATPKRGRPTSSKG
jgi:transcriptional regulator with GAF, ATPase, and Fis domain